jgi:hypothetical protein
MYQAKQGNLGLTKAIDYFNTNGYNIAIPLNDTQPYDLIVEKDGVLSRISVKTSRSKEAGGGYNVQLRNTGGNRTGRCRQVPFNNTSCDWIFIYTYDGCLYLIPSSEIKATNCICVGNKYTEYQVHIKSFNELY